MLASPTHLSHDLTTDAAARCPPRVKYSSVGALFWEAMLRSSSPANSLTRPVKRAHVDPGFHWLLVDINTWSQQSLTSFLALTGRMPSVTVDVSLMFVEPTNLAYFRHFGHHVPNYNKGVFLCGFDRNCVQSQNVSLQVGTWFDIF